MSPPPEDEKYLRDKEARLRRHYEKERGSLPAHTIEIIKQIPHKTEKFPRK